ncbi:MAG: GAF domain-containing protein [bacterium]|nr:GAF domain-containing protein [bacterium]
MARRDAVHNGVHTRELTLLHKVSQWMDDCAGLEFVAEPVLKALSEDLELTQGSIAIFNRYTNEIVIEASYGLSQSQRERGRYRIGEGITGRVVREGRPMTAPSVSHEPEFLNRAAAAKPPRKKDVAFICVPIQWNGESIGALSAYRVIDEGLSLEGDARLLSIVASMVAHPVRMRQTAIEERMGLVQETITRRHEWNTRFRLDDLVGQSEIMLAVFDRIAQIAKSDAAVLLRGEPGGGKEHAARVIHANSPRAERPFVILNCAQLPEDSLDRELFGQAHEPGQNGKTRRPGLIEQAEGGALFIEEISDFSLPLQLKILRFLQTGEYERAGGGGTERGSVRIIAASRRDLESLIQEEYFRQDLYYRLSLFTISIPPLRERKTDIPLLADHFVDKFSRANRKSIYRISSPAIDLLMRYDWPGNVRELENCIERAALLSNNGVIHAHHLPGALQNAGVKTNGQGETLLAILDNVEREIILDTLEAARGNQAKAAKMLGVTERIMGLRLKKHGIDPKQFRTAR